MTDGTVSFCVAWLRLFIANAHRIYTCSLSNISSILYWVAQGVFGEILWTQELTYHSGKYVDTLSHHIFLNPQELLVFRQTLRSAWDRTYACLRPIREIHWQHNPCLIQTRNFYSQVENSTSLRRSYIHLPQKLLNLLFTDVFFVSDYTFSFKFFLEID